MADGDIVFTTLSAQVRGIRKKERESADNARGGKEDVSYLCKYAGSGARGSDFSMDTQIPNREQETKSDGGPC